VALGLAVGTFAGWAVARFFTTGLTGRERVAWSFATGLMIQTACLLLLLAAGVRPTAVRLLGAEAAVAAIALAGARRRPAPGWYPAGRKRDIRALALAGVAAAAWLVFLVTALSDAPFATDFLAIWGAKAKIVFESSSVPGRLFGDPVLAFAHPEYPLLLPLSLAALGVAAGQWDDQALALLYPVFALATLLALSGFLDRRVSRAAGALAAALSALCFFLYAPANVGTAEIPLALAAVLVATAASDFVAASAGASVPRLAVAALFAASLKEEGALFVVLLAVATGLKPTAGTARRAVGAAALLVPVALHGLLEVLARGHRSSRDFDVGLLTHGRWAEIPPRLSAALARAVSVDVLPSMVPILAVAVFLLATKPGSGDWLLPVFAAQLAAYVAAFTLSAFGPAYAVDAALARIAMTLFPAFTLVLAARAPWPGAVSPR
jgi:hypothetical protein